MKKTVYLLFATFILLSLKSCDSISGIKITDQASIDKMISSKIEKHIDPDASIFEISFLNTADFSLEMDIVSVVLLLQGAEEPIQLNITVSGNQEPRETKVLSSRLKNRTADSGLKFSEVDFSKIASNIDKAAQIMQSEAYDLSGVKSYTMATSANRDDVKHSFELRSKDGTSLDTKNGRAAMVTEYYEFNFTANADGEVEYIGD